MKRFLFACMAAAAALLAVPAHADKVSRVDVRFATGSSATSYNGSVRGYDTVEYRLGARAGQAMAVTFRARNPSAYFNVTAPGRDTALFVGQVSGGDFKGVLPVDGTYVVQVYLVRAAARRGESADYTIDFRVDAAGARVPAVPQADFADGFAGGPDFWEVTGLPPGDTLNVRSGPTVNDAILVELDPGTVVRNMGCRPVAGARWCKVEFKGDNAVVGWASGRYLKEAPAGAKAAASKPTATVNGTTGEVECRLPGIDAARACHVSVARRGQGRASVEISLPDGARRTLRFSHGLVTTSDGSTVITGRESGKTVVTVNGTERFVIPDAVVDGD